MLAFFFVFVIFRMFQMPSIEDGRALIEQLQGEWNDGSFPPVIFGLAIFLGFLFGFALGLIVRSPGKNLSFLCFIIKINLLVI